MQTIPFTFEDEMIEAIGKGELDVALVTPATISYYYLLRMAVLTAACVVGAAEWLFAGTQYALIAAAVVIAAGSVVTCVTRTLAIAAKLKES